MFYYSKREALSSCRFVTFPEGAFMLLLWKATHLLGVTSLPAEGGGLRSKTEGECGTFNFDVFFEYAFSLTRLCRELPPGRSLYVTLVEGNSLDVGANSFATTHPPSKTVPLPPLGKALCYSCLKRLTCWRC